MREVPEDIRSNSSFFRFTTALYTFSCSLIRTLCSLSFNSFSSCTSLASRFLNRSILSFNCRVLSIEGAVSGVTASRRC